jgi:hypothetical protein
MKVPLKVRFALILALFAAFALDAINAQQTGLPAPSGQSDGQRGGRGGFGGMMGMGRGVLGTVTEVAPDHYTVKNENGELYTVQFSVNTRILKGSAQRRGQGDAGQGSNPGANPPQTIKAIDIKVGDAIAANGEVDATSKSVGAIVVFLIDPERAKQMREMQANYGKTWLMGKVTAVNDLKVMLEGGPDNATHSFVADENTVFRKRREPITLADVQVGDMIRVEGAVKNGSFMATNVAVMGPRQGESREGGPGGPPQ